MQIKQGQQQSLVLKTMALNELQMLVGIIHKHSFKIKVILLPFTAPVDSPVAIQSLYLQQFLMAHFVITMARSLHLLRHRKLLNLRVQTRLQLRLQLLHLSRQPTQQHLRVLLPHPSLHQRRVHHHQMSLRLSQLRLQAL